MSEKDRKQDMIQNREKEDSKITPDSMETGRKTYDSIEIPEELRERIDKTITSMDREELKKAAWKKRKKQKKILILRTVGSAAAALFICFTVGLNTSEVFARELADVPILGAIAKVLTVRSFDGKEGDLNKHIEVPEIQIQEEENSGHTTDGETMSSSQDGKETQSQAEGMDETGQESGKETSFEDSSESGGETDATESFAGDINAEIQKIVDEHIAQARQNFEDYKEAFFATGGTEEEWGDRDMNVQVDYEVKYQKGNILSMVLTTFEGWAYAHQEEFYYNLDLSENRELTLADVLGEDYVNICNESIDSQIKERIAADENNIYFGYNSGDDGMIEGFTTVTADTTFYINEKGNVVVTFPEYEIAPGYMGAQEFEIGPGMGI